MIYETTGTEGGVPVVDVAKIVFCSVMEGKVMRVLATLAIGFGVLAPMIAEGQTTADPAAGERLALQVCAQCHFVAEDQPLIPRADAPPFDEIAADPGVTEISLRVFFQTPHRNMPNLQLSQQETDDVIGYLLNRKGQVPGK
jgi:mono/diheme cytochrome c family protein